MDAERLRVQADLRGLLDGEVFCDPVQTQLYASDAGVYEVMPLGVVRPRHTADVVQTVKYAADNQLPVFPRGGGTGLAGQALGSGLVLDFSRYMRRVVQLDAEAKTIRVQPGLVLADLNRYLEPRGLLFGPDPATRAVTTIGSVLAVDTSGSHFLKYGSAGSTIISMDVVLANGEPVTLERTAWQEITNPSNSVERLAGRSVSSSGPTVTSFSNSRGGASREAVAIESIKPSIPIGSTWRGCNREPKVRSGS